MSQYTQGKITAHDGGVLHNSNDDVVAATYYCDTTDARRLAACWNAFDGIPTEKFEGKDVSEFVGSQAFLTGMNPTAEGADIGLSGKACQVLAASFAGQFIGTGATNYLEVKMSHPDIGAFTVTMQKSSGLTPADMRERAEKERDEAQAINAELLAALEAAVARQAYKHGGGPEWWESASAAIAKAKGGA